MDYIILFVVAVIANFFSSLAGGGAGLIQLPILLFMQLPYAVALATHKIASVALGLGATLRHLRENTLELKFATFVIAVGVPGVVAGAFLIQGVPDQIARTSLGVLTIALCVYSVAQPALGREYQPRHRTLVGFIMGGSMLFVVGVLNGSLASGTGLFATMILVRWFGLDYQRAVAYTLVTVGLMWNSSGAVALGILGEVRWDWLPALLAGSFVGGYLGAHVAITKGNLLIKRTYEIVTFVIGIKLLTG